MPKYSTTVEQIFWQFDIFNNQGYHEIIGTLEFRKLKQHKNNTISIFQNTLKAAMKILYYEIEETVSLTNIIKIEKKL